VTYLWVEQKYIMIFSDFNIKIEHIAYVYSAATLLACDNLSKTYWEGERSAAAPLHTYEMTGANTVRFER